MLFMENDREQSLVESLIGGGCNLNPLAEGINMANVRVMAEHFKFSVNEDIIRGFSTIQEAASVGEYFKKLFTEAVFGKSSELNECEALLDVCCVEAQKNFGDMFLVKDNMLKVEKIIEKYFGFGCLTLYPEGLVFLNLGRAINPAKKREAAAGEEFDMATGGAGYGYRYGKDGKTLEKVSREQYLNEWRKHDRKAFLLEAVSGMGSPNAFTTKTGFITSVTTQFRDASENLDLSGGRIKWKDGIAPFTYINIGMAALATPQVKGRHALAIILHEVGHSFYQGSMISKLLNVVLSILRSLLLGFKTIDSMLKRAGMSVLAQTTFTKQLFNFAYGIMFNLVNIVMSAMCRMDLSQKVANALGAKNAQIVQDVFSVGKTAITVLKFGDALLAQAGNFVKSITAPMTILTILGMDVLTEEKFCDNFAAAHGYGPELSEALSYINGIVEFNTDQDETAQRGIGYTCSVITAVLTSLLHLTDTHPSFYARPVYMVDFYKAQLAKAKTQKEKEYISSLIVRTMKASPIYKVANRDIKAEMIDRALSDEVLSRDVRNIGVLDYIKDAISNNHGDLENVLNRLGK